MIRRIFRLSLYAGALLVGGGVAWAVFRPTVEGSGKPATETRPISGTPTELVLEGAGEVLLVSGPEPSVRVTADDNVLPLLTTEVSGRQLTLGTSTSRLHARTPIRYQVTLPALAGVSVSGSGSVSGERFTGDKLAVKASGSGVVDLREIKCHSLTVNLSGAGKATVAGVADRSAYKVSGAGIIDAAGLKTTAAEVNISGAGQVKVWATDSLKSRVSGSGLVLYKGSPNVEQKTSGSARVQPLAPEPPAVKGTDGF
ncbi:MAG: DUF2807 domain-containing protein [Gemmataceae bacterium]|nr:DUF2807 domain-containing protein [Gemmataceae bacterium]